MTLDIDKLKDKQDKINEQVIKEIYEELPESLISLIRNTVLNYCLQEVKSPKKEKQSARVLHNWANQGVINVAQSDKGRVSRFNRLENIWLSIVVEARKFGLPLESLKQSRKDLFTSPIKDFGLFKFCVLHSILHKPKVLTISDEGQVIHYSLDLYQKYVSAGIFPMHLSFNLVDFVKEEYPKNRIDEGFNLIDPFSNYNKLFLLYFLKTGDFEEIRLFVNETDIRLIKTPEGVLKNESILKILNEWEFLKIQIIIDKDVETEIFPTDGHR